MKVWTNNSFFGFYPVGSAAVVVADTREQAAELLEKRLAEIGLAFQGAEEKNSKAEDFVEVITDTENVVILCDGDY